MESRVEKIRKYCVIGFIVVGLACIFVEKAQGPKKYVGTAEGFDSEVKVEILAKKNSKGELRITEIVCTHGDTEAIAGPAVESLIATIKSTQDIESLDTVAGATYTSEGFIDAMKNACSKIK
ncbi:FMN-binding protein [uncultured Fusobacterium sp.]|uniref:FMN-binding protein n=1 Tax=uncultured Fusobacterium sp. TaxID=159267 RepID=UPI0025E0DF1F|nr:FMN-binding protein [uncultured Fusobacterium sp.]